MSATLRHLCLPLPVLRMSKPFQLKDFQLKGIDNLNYHFYHYISNIYLFPAGKGLTAVFQRKVALTIKRPRAKMPVHHNVVSLRIKPSCQNQHLTV